MKTVFEARASTILFRLARALPPGPILLPANVCPVVPLAMVLAGRPFEHLDLDPETLAMCPTLLRERLADDERPVAAVLYVRTYGAVDNASALFSEIHVSGALVIDDRCLARPEPDPESYDDQGADVVLFSTGYSKPVDLGFGGFAHFHDQVPYSDVTLEYHAEDLDQITELYKRHIGSRTSMPLESLADFSWLDTRDPGCWAEHRRRLLAKRSEAEEHRARLNAIYQGRLGNVALDSEALDLSFHGWRFQVRVPQRDTVLEAIFKAGHFASAHYYPSSALFGDSLDAAPVAKALADDVLNLFNDFHFDETAAKSVAEIVGDNT